MPSSSRINNNAHSPLHPPQLYIYCCSVVALCLFCYVTRDMLVPCSWAIFYWSFPAKFDCELTHHQLDLSSEPSTLILAGNHNCHFFWHYLKKVPKQILPLLIACICFRSIVYHVEITRVMQQQVQHHQMMQQHQGALFGNSAAPTVSPAPSLLLQQLAAPQFAPQFRMQ